MGILRKSKKKADQAAAAQPEADPPKQEDAAPVEAGSEAESDTISIGTLSSDEEEAAPPVAPEPKPESEAPPAEEAEATDEKPKEVKVTQERAVVPSQPRVKRPSMFDYLCLGVRSKPKYASKYEEGALKGSEDTHEVRIMGFKMAVASQPPRKPGEKAPGFFETQNVAQGLKDSGFTLEDPPEDAENAADKVEPTPPEDAKVEEAPAEAPAAAEPEAPVEEPAAVDATVAADDAAALPEAAAEEVDGESSEVTSVELSSDEEEEEDEEAAEDKD